MARTFDQPSSSKSPRHPWTRHLTPLTSHRLERMCLINISPDSHLIAHLRLPHAQTGDLVRMQTRNVVSPSEPFMILMPVRAPLRFSISHSVQRSKTCPIDAERLVTHSLLTDIALAAIPQQRSKATCPS